MNDQQFDAMLRRRIEKETMTVNPKIESALNKTIRNPAVQREARRVTWRGLALGFAAALLMGAVALAIGVPAPDVTTEGTLALSQPAGNEPSPTPMPLVTPVATATLVTPLSTDTLVPFVTPAPTATLGQPTVTPAATATPVPETLFASDISADSEGAEAQYAGLRLSVSETLRNGNDRWLYVAWEPLVDTFIFDRAQVAATPTEQLIQPGGSYTFGFTDYLIIRPYYTDVWLGTQYHSYEVLAGEENICRMASFASPGDEDYETEQAYIQSCYDSGQLVVFGGKLILPDSMTAGDNSLAYRIEAYANKGLISYNPISSVDRKDYAYGERPAYDASAEPLASYAGDGYTARLMNVGDYANPYLLIDCVYDSEEAMNALLAARPGLYYSAVDYEQHARYAATDACGEWQDESGVWHSTYVQIAVDATACQSGDVLRIFPSLNGDVVSLEEEAIVYTLP